MADLTTHIYTLHDPQGEVRYVGKTILPIQERLALHISNAKRSSNRSYSGNWIRSLISKGELPTVQLVQTIVGAEWIAAEKFWIQEFRSRGYRLVNLTEGGEGHPGHRPSLETIQKRKLARKGYQHSVETRQKMSLSALNRDPNSIRRGWNHSPETIGKIQRSWEDRDLTQYLQAGVARRMLNCLVPITDRVYERPVEWRQAIGDANRGANNGQAKLNEKKVREIKVLLSEGNLSQSSIAEQFDVSRGLVGLIQRNLRWAHVHWPEKVAFDG